jgi:hypothetical protein
MHSARFKTFGRTAIHELEELAILTAYLAVFFFVLATYSMLLLGKFHISYFAYGTALINALLTAKVILIGEAMHVGRRFEGRSLLCTALSKSLVFGLLVFSFHLSEEIVKQLFRGQNAAVVFREIRLDDLLMRTIVIICTFVPLFIFRELRRVVGDDQLRDIFLRVKRESHEAVPTTSGKVATKRSQSSSIRDTDEQSSETGQLRTPMSFNLDGRPVKISQDLT